MGNGKRPYRSSPVSAAPSGGILRHEHPHRRVLGNEVHARPHELLSAPLRATHLVMVTGERAFKQDRAHLLELCGLFGVDPPPLNAAYFSAVFGSFRLRWERHTEFSTYTVFSAEPFDDPFEQAALDLVPADWIETLPGRVMAALHLAVEARERAPADLPTLFEGHAVVGSQVQSGAALVWTDFHIHADGFGRILVRDMGLTRGQTGRLVQRLTEIETYRLLALRAFPLAREIGPRISELERTVAEITGEMAQGESAESDRELLSRLTRLAAESEKIAAESSYPFSAARAYYALVRRRIEELREERIEGIQTIHEFMDRRLAPAMRTCESVVEREEVLSRRLERAGGLLRTRVDIALEEKNRDLLHSMNRRARLQLRLQETVEGLSVAAISYYLVSLIGYAAKGARAGGAPLDPDVVMMASIPVVVGAVWFGVRRLRRALNHRDED